MSVSPLLPASLGALGVGPLLSRYSSSKRGLAEFLDSFIVVSIGGLVILDILPHALEHRDLVAVVFMALGYFLPGFAERMLQYGVRRTHTFVLLVALLGVAAHSMLDGSALAQAHHDPGSLLGYGVLLHQIPVGLMVWWVLRDRPQALVWLVIAFMAAMTVLGYWVEPTVLALLPERAALWFEALVGGSLLHVVGHSNHDHTHEHTHDHLHDHADAHSESEYWTLLGFKTSAGGMGSLLGLLVLGVLQLVNTPSHGGSDAAGEQLLSLILISAPALLFSFGALAVIISIGYLRRKPLRLGGTIGVPGSAGSDRFGSLSLEATLLSVPLLGVPLAVVRLVLARLIAALAPPMARSDDRNDDRPDVRQLELSRGPGADWVLAISESLPWILAGLVGAAVLESVIQGSWLVGAPAVADVLALALIASIVRIHAAALVPMAAILITAGVTPGAALAMLLTGPLPEIWRPFIHSRSQGFIAALKTAFTAPAAAVISGVALNGASDRVLPWVWNGTISTTTRVPAAIAAILLALLCLWMISRNNVRSFLKPLGDL